MEERLALMRRCGDDVISAELRFPVLIRSEWKRDSAPQFPHLQNEDTGRRFLRSLLAPPFLTPLSWRCSKLGPDSFGANLTRIEGPPLILDHSSPTAARRWWEFSVAPAPLPQRVALAPCLSPLPSVVGSGRPLSRDGPKPEPGPLYSLTVPIN